MSFQIQALPSNIAAEWFQKSPEDWQRENARLVVANSSLGFPCRLSLQDAEVGEELLLFPYLHHDVATPYRSAGPIYVRRAAMQAQLEVDECPAVFKTRQLSLRAYSSKGYLTDARVCQGEETASAIHELFQVDKINQIHVHFAAPGCFACRIERA